MLPQRDEDMVVHFWRTADLETLDVMLDPKLLREDVDKNALVERTRSSADENVAQYDLNEL